MPPLDPLTRFRARAAINVTLSAAKNLCIPFVSFVVNDFRSALLRVSLRQ